MTQQNDSIPTTQPKPILLMAGGTGGHVFPALAIAQALRSQEIMVYWLGTQRGLEARIIPPTGIEIKYISISGLRGKGWLSLLTAPFKIVFATWQAWRIIKQLQPAAVVGFGGFVTGPGGVAAWLHGTPLLIHEQNSILGLTNRWLARIASQVMEAFAGTFPAHYRAIHTGNPLRTEIMALSMAKVIHNPLRILILGGSLGAQALNEKVPIALKQVRGNLEVWHQAGEAHLADMKDAYKQATFPVKVMAFIDDMAAAYTWADLVICRAGALTISELAQTGVGSILIPYPHAVDDHQTTNAQFLVNAGAAILIPQSQLSVEQLVTVLTEFYNKPQQLQQMAEAARRCATPQALPQIMQLVLNNAHPLEHC